MVGATGPVQRMLQVDVISAYVICGAGSFVGAGVMMLARPADPRTRNALQVCSAAFLVVGAALFHFLFFDTHWPELGSLFVATEGVIIGTALFGWGFARLNGRRLQRAQVMLGVAVCAGGVAAMVPFGVHAFHAAFCLAALVVGTWIVVTQWNYLARPRNRAELALGLSILAYTLTWVAQLLFSLNHHGPAPAGFIFAPPAAQSLFAVFYGVIPIIIASLVLNLVNARLSEQLSLRAMTDELTGLLVRRALHEQVPGFVEQAERAGRRVALLMLDLDHFKRINDTHGHLGGDAVLRHVAKVLHTQLRADALVSRYGGEEFIVVLAVAGLHDARIVAERLRQSLAATVCRAGTAKVNVTASIGIATLDRSDALQAAIERADQAMYRAKQGGRNRVEISLSQAA